LRVLERTGLGSRGEHDLGLLQRSGIQGVLVAHGVIVGTQAASHGAGAAGP